MWSETELEFRRRRYRQLVDEWTAAGGPETRERKIAERAAVHSEVHEQVVDFVEGRSDAAALRGFIDSWSRRNRVFGFAGTAGAMVLNQLVKDSQAGEADRVLRNAFRVPSDIDAAVAQINAVADFTAELRKRGSGAAIGRAPFFTSWFWWIQDPVWEPRFPFGGVVLESMAWVDPNPETAGQRYADFHSLLTALDDDIARASEVLWWMGSEDEDGKRPIVGLDETLSERCERVYQLPREPRSDNDVEWQESRDNVSIVLAELARVGSLGVPLLQEHFGYDTKPHVPSPFWIVGPQRLRGSSWVSWRHRDRTVPFPGIRLHVDGAGVQITLNAEVGFNPKGSLDLLRQELSATPIPGAAFMMFAPGSDDIEALRPAEPGELWTDVGGAMKLDDLRTGQQLVDQLTDSFEMLMPAARRVSQLASAADSSPDALAVVTEPADLAGLLARFRESKEYPTASDRSNIAAGTEFRALLQRDHLPALTKQDFRRIYAQRYGSPGAQPTLNRTVRDADESEWERILGVLDYLLWDGDDPVADRIDRVLSDDDLRIAGLGPSVIMKLLAITHDDLNCLVYPYSGESGKAAVLERLGQPLPSATTSQGARQLEAIRGIRSALSGLELEPWEEMVFLYWLVQEYEEDPVEMDTEDAAQSEDNVEQLLVEAADDLYLDVGFLSEIVDLLKRHRQVVFFGPPGTGKTFIAQRLAQIIAPEEHQRRLVQFHPSTSYEDFVEGYRPMVQGDQLTYVLQPGPLRDLADAAQADPRNTYLLIIDEINRANLPRVLGELLFLLEYRDQSVRPLYRPDEDFSLPENLWIIGTMNTADRSVALLDAALRRRFQFVDFSPDVMGTGPISQVLGNWVKSKDEMEILPNIVDSLNNRLRSELGGDHLAFGPSFFMRSGIDEQELRSIWRYQVQPLIDDLFLGDPDRARRFALDDILSELGQDAGANVDPEDI